MCTKKYKPIIGYEGHYIICDDSEIISIKYNKKRTIKSRLDKDGYLRVVLYKNGFPTTKKVHQLVAICFLEHIPCGNKIVVDHIDRNKLNNNVENLQLISQRQNLSKDKKNKSSKYTGVSWHIQRKKWYAAIRIDGKKVNLGSYLNEEDARDAYNKKLAELLEK